jgi:glycogen debranching enzyme
MNDLPDLGGTTSAVDAFFVSATSSLQEQRPRTLKHGDLFGVFDHAGNVLAGKGEAGGLYFRDTRHVSRLDLFIAGLRPLLLSSDVREDNALLTCDLTNPDLRTAATTPDGETELLLEHDLVHIRRSKFLFDTGCYERVAVRSYADTTLAVAMEFRFAADFADLFEVRGQRRPARGTVHPPRYEAGEVVLSYTGLDDLLRETRLRFDPPPDRVEPGRALFDLTLAPGARSTIYVEVQCDGRPFSAPPPEAYFLGLSQARRALRRSASRAASVQTSNDIFNEAVRRSVSDLYMLMTDTEQGAYPYAGIPWYSTAFGRDALITAMMMLWMDPAVARGVLRYLAANQATETDPSADAEPGKILHEVRHGEMAELKEVPFRRYYGSVDATPLFVMLAGGYLRRTGDVATLQALWPHVEAALHWIDNCGDRDGDGFVEYYRATETGLANQGWKDSHDSVFHADGSMAQGPIALVEVQGYVYRARREAAEIAARLGHAARATALNIQAETLRTRIEEAFWCEDIGSYALALDGAKQPCRVRSSNAGHLLLAGVAEPGRAARVAEQLLGSAFFSGWGVRTIGTSEARYNPMSYHNGSVWPHDNALIGMGMGSYGLRHDAARILEGLFEASTYIDLRRLPELVCGFPRRRGQGPTFYPVACVPQAWSAASPLALLQACLGLGFDPVTRTVSFDRPVMPSFTDRITLRGLSVGGARLDVLLQGHGDAVSATVLARSGDIRATVTS